MAVHTRPSLQFWRRRLRPVLRNFWDTSSAAEGVLRESCAGLVVTSTEEVWCESIATHRARAVVVCMGAEARPSVEVNEWRAACRWRTPW